MKYPSLDTIRDWYISSDPNKDSRITRKPQISNGKICGNSTDGFYWCGDNGQIRIHVAPYVGKDDSKCACDQGKILTRGWMETDKDWRNYEILGEMRLKGAGDELQLYGRGEYHYSSSSSADCDSCKGSSIRLSIELTDARIRYAFETYHSNYNYTGFTDVPATVLAGYANNNLYDQWFRFIHCVYNIESNTKVVCELYISKGLTNEFFLIKKIVVPGGVTWTSGYNGAKACGCPTDTTPILWGGPIVSYRWDDMDDSTAVKFRKLAIREINVAGSFPSESPPTSTGTLSNNWRDIFSIGTRSIGDSCSGAAIGTAPFTLVYDCSTGTLERAITDDVTQFHRTRIVEKIKNTGSVLFGIKPRKVEIEIARVNSPGGNAKCAIWDGSNNEVVSFGIISAGSVSTDFSTTQTFINEDAPAAMLNGMQDEWSIGIEWLGTSASDYIKLRLDDSNPIDGSDSVDGQYESGVMKEFSDRDLRMKVYI